MPRKKSLSDDQILKVAREMFLTHGVNVPVTKIAKKLGVASGTIFLRMGSKENLLRRAMDWQDPACMGRLRKGPVADRPVRDQLLDVLYELTDYVNIPKAFAEIAALGTPKPAARVPRGQAQELRRLVGRWVAAGAQRGEFSIRRADVAGDLLIAAIEAQSLAEIISMAHRTARQRRTYVRRVVEELLDPDGP